jgi:hypothetical protein
MAVSAISNLSTWLNQVNGSKSQNLNALGSSKQSTGTSQTSGTGASQANSGQLAALFENLLQQLVAAGGTTSAAGAGISATGGTTSATAGATQTAAQSATQGAQGHGRGHHAQMALNQLLQELKLGSSSTTTTAASAAGSAQSTGSQQLMSMLQQLAQGGSSAVGSIVSALV